MVNHNAIIPLNGKDSALNKIAGLLDSAKQALDSNNYIKGIGLLHNGAKRLIQSKKVNNAALEDIYGRMMKSMNKGIGRHALNPYIHESYPVFDSAISLQSFLLANKDSLNDAFRFRLSLDKAGLYLATDRRSNTLDILSEMKVWVADSSHLQQVMQWQCGNG